MDASNHDMLGTLARELSSILHPLAINISNSSRESAETFQKISSQMNRMADFMGVPQPKRRNNQTSYREGEPILERIQNTVPPPGATITGVTPPSGATTAGVIPPQRITTVERNPIIDLQPSNRRTVPVRREFEEERPRLRIVGRDEHPDEVVERVRRENLAIENNLTAMIERVMANNASILGFDVQIIHLP